MADTPEEIKSHFKLYFTIAGVLFVGTVLTVLVATVESLDIGGHGFDTYDLVLGLAIATFKMCCVGYVFMHLNHEKKAIYWIFFGSLAFAAILIGLFGWAFGDPIIFDGMLPAKPGQ
ncbi:cytochrome C oxidase subunit IV family protein [Rubritalea marina]|uniref:cytochrome C oxidase subunit IV family protein n=1 Tax=Rubritalea marina TaxID=361055 RepID=UPI00036406C7|nr:cytochrome C oxidase subunit IV family protein [Rubritalea marina]